MHFTHIRKRLPNIKSSVENLDFEEEEKHYKPTIQIVDALG